MTVPSPDARSVRLRGIAELLAEPDFDEVGHLHNDDARFLLAEVRRLRDLVAEFRKRDETATRVIEGLRQPDGNDGGEAK